MDDHSLYEHIRDEVLIQLEGTINTESFDDLRDVRHIIERRLKQARVPERKIIREHMLEILLADLKHRR